MGISASCKKLLALIRRNAVLGKARSGTRKAPNRTAPMNISSAPRSAAVSERRPSQDAARTQPSAKALPSNTSGTPTRRSQVP
jgi:hypothetical protein